MRKEKAQKRRWAMERARERGSIISFDYDNSKPIAGRDAQKEAPQNADSSVDQEIMATDVADITSSGKEENRTSPTNDLSLVMRTPSIIPADEEEVLEPDKKIMQESAIYSVCP